MTQKERLIPLEGNFNTRDIGGYQTSNGGTVAWGKFVRSDGLHNLTAADQEKLIDYGIRTIIDLRHSGELSDFPNPFATRPEIDYHNISFFDGTLDPHAPLDDNLTMVDLYKLSLRQSQHTIKAVFDMLSEAETYPVLVHCTAGKDRTGITAAFALRLAGVPDETIITDYGDTNRYLAPWVENIVTHFKNMGRDPGPVQERLKAEPVWMAALLAHVDAEYGGVESYLQSIGLKETQIDRIRAELLG